MLLVVMLATFLAVALQILSAPPELLKGQLQGAIWRDLQSNAMIGNGNWLASLWYQAGSETVSDLHIQELACTKTSSGHRCSFVLHRDGGPATVLNEMAPDNLACVADFVPTKTDWRIVHRPPHRAGHSKTSMQCKAGTA
jgi:hypothetical protein